MKKGAPLAKALAAAALTLLALSAGSPASGAGVSDECGCHFLHVVIGLGETEVISVTCSKGQVKSRTPKIAIMQQYDGRGPDCHVVLLSKDEWGSVFQAEMDVQQNLCVMKAGNIHVRPTSGDIEYETREGSFSAGRPGVIRIKKVTP